MKSRKLATAVLAACMSITPLTAWAQGHGQGRGHAKPDKAHKVETVEVHHAAPAHEVVIDRDGHVRVIHEYVVAGSLPPGLAKREALPPGLRAQLHERGELPPGLQKRFIAVPAPLIARLPPVPSYYHRYFVGDDFIVVDARSNRLVAIIPIVWR